MFLADEKLGNIHVLRASFDEDERHPAMRSEHRSCALKGRNMRSS